MKTKTSTTVAEICLAEISDPNPIHFRDARREPGVYKLQKWTGSAAIVVINTDTIVYVNDGGTSDTVWKDYSDHVVYKTSMPVPDEITK